MSCDYVNVNNAFFSSQEIPYLSQDTYVTDRNPRGTVVANCFAHAFNSGSIDRDYQGAIGPMYANVTLENDVDIIGYSQGTYTNIVWTKNEDDRFNLHNVNDRPHRVYIRDSGIYSVTGNVIVKHNEDGKFINGILLQLDNGNLGEIFASAASNAGVRNNITAGTSINWTGYLKEGTWITLGIIPLLGDSATSPSSLLMLKDSYLSIYRNS